MFSSLNYAELCFVGSALLVTLVGYALQWQHLRLHPRIQNPIQMREFTAMVRMQMYLALVFICTAMVAIALIFFDKGELSAGARFLLWLPYGLMFVTGLIHKRLEKKVRDVARCDPAHLEEFERVCYAWSKSVFPNF